MSAAYVDSSCFVAIALGELSHRELMVYVSRFDRIYSSTLLEAELCSALAREGKTGRVRNLLSWLNWIYPRHRLTRQFEQILEVGTLKGSDLWHLACALSVRPRLPDLFFISLDGRQSEIARSLGFRGL